MVTTDGCQRLGETITYYHINTDGMDEFFHMSTHGSTCRGEEMGILQSQFFTNKREHSAVEHLILQMECHRRFLTQAQILDIMLSTYGEGMLEEFTLHGTGMLYLIHHTHIHLLPKTGHTRHTSRMSLPHRLLHLLRMGVHYHRSTFSQRENSPTTLKDMRIRQEVHHAVFLIDRHTFSISDESGMELRMRQDDTLRLARRTTRIEDIGDVIE